MEILWDLQHTINNSEQVKFQSSQSSQISQTLIALRLKRKRERNKKRTFTLNYNKNSTVCRSVSLTTRQNNKHKEPGNLNNPPTSPQFTNRRYPISIRGGKNSNHVSHITWCRHFTQTKELAAANWHYESVIWKTSAVKVKYGASLRDFEGF